MKIQNTFAFINLILYLGHCSAHVVKLDDKHFIEDTDLFIKDLPENGLSQTPDEHQRPGYRDFLNPMYWLRKFFQLIPEMGFWILGVREYDCRYLTVCQTSNFLVNNAPKSLLSWFNGSHTGLLSRIIGETPYIEAWSIGSIKSIDCSVLYDCFEPPFDFRSKFFL